MLEIQSDTNVCHFSGSLTNSYTIQMVILIELTKQPILSVKKIQRHTLTSSILHQRSLNIVMFQHIGNHDVSAIWEEICKGTGNYSEKMMIVPAVP